MLIIKINSRATETDKDKAIKFEALDLAISAYKLKETIPALKMFIKHLELIERQDATAFILNNSRSLETHQFFLVKKEKKKLKRESIIFFYRIDKVNWEILCASYILFNSFDKQRDKLYEDYLEYVKLERIEQVRFAKKVEAFKHELTTIPPQLRFFNHKKFHLLLRKNKVKLFTVKYDDESNASILTFSDVKLGNEEIGIIKYKKIILYVKDWTIIRYKLIFNDFSYDTKDVELSKIILHPYLKLQSLLPYHTWIKLGDYESFGIFLFKIVREYNPNDGKLLPLEQIIKNYFELRYLWGQKKIKPKGIEEKLSQFTNHK